MDLPQPEETTAAADHWENVARHWEGVARHWQSMVLDGSQNPQQGVWERRHAHADTEPVPSTTPLAESKGDEMDAMAVCAALGYKPTELAGLRRDRGFPEPTRIDRARGNKQFWQVRAVRDWAVKQAHASSKWREWVRLARHVVSLEG